MTDTRTTAWLVELVQLLGRWGEHDESDETALDELLTRGLDAPFDAESMAGVDPLMLSSAVAMLSSARSVAASELAAVHRQRIDVDRTVRAITAYVRSLA